MEHKAFENVKVSMEHKAFENIKVSIPKPGVGLSEQSFPLDQQLSSLLTCIRKVTLHRPRALNALSTPLFHELNDALTGFDADKDVGAIVITGSEKAFAGIRRPLQTQSHGLVVN